MGDTAAFDAFLSEHTSGELAPLATPAADSTQDSNAPKPSPFAGLVQTMPAGASSQPPPQAQPSAQPARSASLGTFASAETPTTLNSQERQSLMQEAGSRDAENPEYIGPPEDLRDSNGGYSDAHHPDVNLLLCAAVSGALMQLVQECRIACARGVETTVPKTKQWKEDITARMDEQGWFTPRFTWFHVAVAALGVLIVFIVTLLNVSW